MYCSLSPNKQCYLDILKCTYFLSYADGIRVTFPEGFVLYRTRAYTSGFLVSVYVWKAL